MMTKGAFSALVQANEARVKSAKMPRQAPPDAQRRRYSRALRGRMLPDMIAAVRIALVPKLERFAEQASKVAVTDADELGSLVDSAEETFFKKWTRARMSTLVRPVAEETEKFQATQLNKQMRSAVGVDVVGSEPWLERAIDEFTAENVALIRSIPTRFFDDLETHLKREIADGARWEELAGIVEERYSVSQSRADLIARDQVGKFYGDLNRVRQGDLGITGFLWRTMRDNRVREEHEERDGERYDWKSPPDGETPGEPVLCRCYADPDLAGVLEAEPAAEPPAPVRAPEPVERAPVEPTPEPVRAPVEPAPVELAPEPPPVELAPEPLPAPVEPASEARNVPIPDEPRLKLTEAESRLLEERGLGFMRPPRPGEEYAASSVRPQIKLPFDRERMNYGAIVEYFESEAKPWRVKSPDLYKSARGAGFETLEGALNAFEAKRAKLPKLPKD